MTDRIPEWYRNFSYSEFYGDAPLEAAFDELVEAAKKRGIGFTLSEFDDGTRMMKLTPEAVAPWWVSDPPDYTPAIYTKRTVDGRETVLVARGFLPLVSMLLTSDQGAAG